MLRKTRLLTCLACLALTSLASATMVHQDWDTGVTGSRQAIIDFLVDLVNPVPPLQSLLEGFTENAQRIGDILQPLDDLLGS